MKTGAAKEPSNSCRASSLGFWAGKIRTELGIDIVLNRCVVYETDQAAWFRETAEKFGIQNLVLVGGESSQIQYPGPNVAQAAREILATGLPSTLGGISIPSRSHEVERIRRKAAEGLKLFYNPGSV